MSKYDLVIFDNDGVLVDSELFYPKAWQHVLSTEGIDVSVEECLTYFLGRSTVNNIQFINEKFELNLPVEKTKKRFYDYAHSCFEKELKPVDGIVDLLISLNKPYCVGTSSLTESLRDKHRWAGITHLFDQDVLFTSEMVKNGKPAPDLFLHASKEMGAVPEKCLVVEDSPYGIQAAKAAGMFAVGFVGGSHFKTYTENASQVLKEAGADIIIKDINELLPIING